MFDPVAEFLGPTDRRMTEYPLMKSVLPTVFFSSIYLLFIKVVGPTWMKNKEPYSLRRFMLLYNCTLIGINGWIHWNLLRYGWLATYSWRCEPIDTSNNPAAVKMVQICWVFYISKLIDYLDTVIFVLRKKESQINFLHVFHHSTVPVTVWLGVSYGPGGYNTLCPLLNSFVHVCMYSYYGLAAFGQEMRKYLWWKKYLTLLQLVQFTVIFLYFIHLCLFVPKNCNVSTLLVWISLGQTVLYLGLFVNFYLHSYKTPPGITEHRNGSVVSRKAD